jgi:hypothetical protein
MYFISATEAQKPDFHFKVGLEVSRYREIYCEVGYF